jgi:hypothetical protein
MTWDGQVREDPVHLTSDVIFSPRPAGLWRVKRWRDGKMVLRWRAAALLVAKAGFHRIQGHAHVPQLKAALRAHQNSQPAPLDKAA